MDVRKMFDQSPYLTHLDLPRDRDAVVTIERVYPGELVGEKGRKSKKPFMTFVGKRKPFALNKTNAKTLIALFGPEVDQWRGKRIGLYVTTTDYERQTVECIRIRPSVPRGKADEPADPVQSESHEPPVTTDGGEPPPDVVLPTLADQKEPRQ